MSDRTSTDLHSATPRPPTLDVVTQTIMTQTTTTALRSSTRLALLAAAIALTLGIWLLLDAFGVPVPSFGRYWPMFLIVGGLASLVDFLWLSGPPRSAGQAMLGIGLGLLMFSITLGWTRLLTFWDWFPGVPLVLGLAFLTTWLAGGRRRGELLLVGIVFCVLGLLGFVAAYPVIRNILPSAQLIWALALLAGGGIALWRILASRGTR
jgi:hypothetical protein